MNHTFLYIVSFNILAIPAVIYFHVKGECEMLTRIFAGAQQYCSSVSNPFINLLFINGAFFIIALLVYANSQIPQSQSYPKKFPPGGFKKGK